MLIEELKEKLKIMKTFFKYTKIGHDSYVHLYVPTSLLFIVFSVSSEFKIYKICKVLIMHWNYRNKSQMQIHFFSF